MVKRLFSNHAQGPAFNPQKCLVNKESAEKLFIVKERLLRGCRTSVKS